MKFRLTESRENYIWASNAQREYYYDLSTEELRNEVINMGGEEDFEFEYDIPVEEAEDDDLLDFLMPDDIDLDYEDFTENIMPMIENQCEGDVLVLFGSAANWQGSREACAVIKPEEFEHYIYPRYEAISRIYSDNGNLYYTQSSHDTPMGGTEMYLYSFKSYDDYDKAEEMFAEDDGIFGPEDWDYKDVGNLIKDGLLTPVRNSFNESLNKLNLNEGWVDDYQDFGDDSILDSLGSDYECVVAMYDMLGYNTDDEFFYETVEDDWDYGRLEIKNGKFILNKDGRTIMCSGRDSSNFPIVWEETNESLKESVMSLGDIVKNALTKLNKESSLDEIKDALSAEVDKFNKVYPDSPLSQKDWNELFDETVLILSGNIDKPLVNKKFVKSFYDDIKLKEGFSNKELMDAVEDAYGYKGKEARDYIKSIDDKTAEELVKGFKMNAKKNFYEAIDTDQIREQVDALTDDIDAFEGDLEKCSVTWNFGEDENGDLTGGIDLRPHPSVEDDEEACKELCSELEAIFRRNGFDLDDRFKNPRKGLFGSYHYQIIKSDKIAEDVKRYSDAYDDETRQKGWWYFTTHGVGPGTIPKDLHVLETREGQNDKGTWGDFIRLDGILNTDELNRYDLRELAPTDLEEDFSGFFSDYEFNESFNKKIDEAKIEVVDDYKLQKGDEITLWWKGSNDETQYAKVEYLGRDKNGNYKFESTTYGWIYLVSKDKSKVKMPNKDEWRDMIDRGVKKSFPESLSKELKEAKNADKAIEKAQKDKEKIAKKYDVFPTAIVWRGGNKFTVVKNGKEIEVNSESLEEDTEKNSKGKWVNKGKEGTHGEFKTKKEADAQRKAIFANWKK